MSQNNGHSDALSSLACFTENLISISKNDSLFDFIVDSIMNIIGCNQASFMLFDAKSLNMQLIKVRGFRNEQYRSPRIELTGDVERSLFNGGEVLAPAAEGHNEFLIIFDEEERKYFDCEIRVPFFIKENLLGVLNVGKKSTGTEYSTGDINLLRVLITNATIAIENYFLQAGTNGRKTAGNQKERSAAPNLRIKRKSDMQGMIGESAEMKKIKRLIEKVAPTDVTAYIDGESGTGKELVAKAIHQNSVRSHKPLVTLNCAALPENLVESELFGHERGAFTGAHVQKKGKFEIANGSTLFLDEIGDMSLATQSKFLRVLQDKTFQRIGGHENIKVDVRIIVATHKDLKQLIREKNFREDLFYRINVVQIMLPPLRKRKEDIPLFVNYFLEKYNKFYGTSMQGIRDEDLFKLMLYDFPGNIRELQNMIERAVIFGQGHELSLDSVPLTPSQNVELYPRGTFDVSLQNVEKEYIRKVMEQVNFNKSRAARILGIARKTLREKLQKYDI
ncbi:AAA family ATPase [candidate division KSB1 bacterium]|nr:AAA family ATPase [candidate division KSB1 bacterium]